MKTPLESKQTSKAQNATLVTLFESKKTNNLSSWSSPEPENIVPGKSILYF